MSKRIVNTEHAPKAIGYYSQGNTISGKTLVFVSGQIAIDPATATVIEGGIVEQTNRVLMNVGAILKEAGSGYDRVLKTTVYLKNMSDFQTMNEVYSHYFTQNYPARATVQVAGLPRDVLVEIDAIAYVD